VLLVGALDTDSAPAESSSLVNLVAERLIGALEPEDDLARIGHQEFAVLASLPRAEDARRLAAHLERALVGSGVGVTFGWATFPQDGDNALSLYRAAEERLYARRVISRNEPTVVALRRPAG
jgi:GGDEF domain-containing protein